MKYTLLFILLASSAFAQYRQLAGSSGSVAGKVESPNHSSTVLVGQPVIGEASGGGFGTRGGMTSIFEETIIALDVNDVPTPLPSDYSFAQNFPNPFNPSTMFEFALPRASSATLVIYDQLGREAARVFERELPAGTFSVSFLAPAAWASGVYFAVFHAGEYNQVRKIVLLK